jgi:hypothetical protein
VPYRPGPLASSLSSARPYPRDNPVDQFADRWRDENRGQWFEVESLDPSCLLLKRELLDRLGPFDRLARHLDRRGMPRLLDGQILGQSVREAGFRLACCRDLFIHGWGSRTAIPLTTTPR